MQENGFNIMRWQVRVNGKARMDGFIGDEKFKSRKSGGTFRGEFIRVQVGLAPVCHVCFKLQLVRWANWAISGSMTREN